jgi:hypothetical protein
MEYCHCHCRVLHDCHTIKFCITRALLGECNLLQPAGIASRRSSVATGYLFRNAQYRLDLHRSMDDGEVAAAQQLPGGFSPAPPPVSSMAAPEVQSASCGAWEGYAEGSQKTRVTGEVLRWHHERGPTPMLATDYIALLEAEVAALRQQVGPYFHPWPMPSMIHQTGLSACCCRPRSQPRSTACWSAAAEVASRREVAGGTAAGACATRRGSGGRGGCCGIFYENSTQAGYDPWVMARRMHRRSRALGRARRAVMACWTTCAASTARRSRS